MILSIIAQVDGIPDDLNLLDIRREMVIHFWAQRHRKKRKGREEYLIRQKQHNNEDSKRLAKKRSSQRVSKSSPAKVVPGEILSPDIPPFKKSKGKGQGKSSEGNSCKK